MRTTLVIVGAILCSLVLVFAEERSSAVTAVGSAVTASGPEARDDHDDHDDSGPIQVGYAVVTPASFSTNGTKNMAVFETFGLREGLGATQAGVLPPGLTTDAILFVDSEGALRKNLGVAIVNPNANPENVTLTLRGSDGKMLGSTTVNVLSNHQVSKFITELFSGQPSVPKDVTGTLTITSTNPVAVIGLRFRGSNFSTLPITNLVPAGSGPSVLLPEFVAGGGWATEIVIVNNDTVPLTVRVDLFKQDGTPLSAKLNNQPAASSFTNITIPAGGVFVLAPRNGEGSDDF